MWRQWLTLLIITLSFYQFAKATRYGVCQNTKVEKEPCTNGTRNIRITTYVKDNGVCTPFRTKTQVNCESKRKDFCKCSAVGDPHYRTYDGQVIHFYGDCRYTLTQHNREDDPCSFNIEVQNEYRGDNKYFTYTKSVIIHMFREVYELGQKGVLKVNGQLSRVPYEKSDDVRIFKSRKFLQFVAPRCSVRVAFDGDSNAFVEVSKRYSKKMNGICGDCNGVRDDFKTKSGRDVSNKRNKYSLIGNSYHVSKPGHHCKKAKDISYHSICGKDWIRSLKAKKHCGVLLEPNNPFSKCARKGNVDLRNFFQDCVIDMCVNKNRPSRWQKVRCEIFSGLAEVCSEAGFEGIKWRSQFNCPLQCGKNAHFSEKANPCPRTCENHFFGTKRPCYDLPEREGCACNRGYIRDGALCVKPMHCKCINLCVDRESSEKCRKWKQQGQCKELSEAMNIICPKTCGFCKATAGHCEDELSARKCLEFRNKGLCYHDFYKAICGLTCNYDKCNCGKERIFVGKCDMSTNRITTTHYKFARDSQGRCAKIITQSHKACNCNKVTKVRKRCNLCTGIRKIILHIKEIVANKCVRRKRVIVEKCNKCHKRIRKQRRCIGNRSIKTTITFYKLKGCYLCVLERKSRTIVIKCKSTKTVKRDRLTCVEYTKIIRRRPVNCRCREDVINRRRKWCCNKKPKHLPPKCQNGRIIHRTIYYKFHRNGCVPHFKDVIEIPKCKPERKSIKGKCVRKRHGRFFCKAIDFKLVRKLNSKCKCITRKLTCMRTCCCRKSKRCTTCNWRMGIQTVVTTRYRLVKKRHRYVCVRFEKRVSKTIRFKTQFIVIKGKCGANCLRKDTIIRKFRYGCKVIKRFSRHEVRLCCCRPKQRKFICCIGNDIVVKVYKRILKANRCVRVVKTCHKKRIRCPPKVVKESKCVYRRRRRKITTISYFLKKCKCFKRTRICYKRCPGCQYKVLGTKTGKCDKTTCFRRTYIFFQNEKCQKGTKICDYRCCCPFRKIKRSYCNRCNGIRYDILKWWEFNEKLRTCIPRSKRIAFVPKCKRGIKVKGKCGVERKNYIKIITTSERFSKSKCKCRKFRCVTWKVCKCPLRKVVKKTCRGTFYQIKEYEYHLDKIRNKCLRRTIRRRDGVLCPMIAKTKRKNITKCTYKIYTGIMKPTNCRCKWVWRAEKFYECCDEKSSETTKCKKKRFIVTKSITYQLISRRRPCIRRVKRSSIAITCKKYIRIRRTRCKNGIYWIITNFYQVNNCKCGKVRTTRRKVICECIPSETVKRICIGAGHQKIVTKYILINEKCIAHSKVTFYPKKCPPSYDVRSKCDRKTGLITVRRIYHVSKNCKCVREKLTLTVRCPCFRKDRIVRRRCDKKGRRTIEIQRRVSSKRKCIWKVIKSYWEDCRCPRPRSITRCVEHGIYRTKTTFYLLKVTFTHAIPLQKCVKFEREKDRKIICNRGYVTKTCVRHRKIEVRCIYEKRNCRCVKYCKTVITGPCKCKRLNKCSEKCIKNVRYNVCYRFKAGRKHCIKSRHDYPIREKCPRRKIECKSCSLRKNNGVYRSCRITYFVYHNCKCVEKHRYRLRLCKCGGDITSRPRCVNNRKVIETTSFYRVKNHCVGRKRQHFILINCFRPRLRITELKCSTSYKLEYFYLRNCKCVKITIIRKNSKCCIKPIFTKKCKKHHWVLTIKSFHQRPTNIKLFPEINSRIKATFCEISKKRWVKHVICKPPYKTKVCYPKHNRLVIKTYFYVVINCKCKLKVSKKVKKCVKCPKTKIIRSACGPRGEKGRRYLNVTIKRYIPTRQNKCKLIINRRIEVCECEKTKKMKLCKSGQRIFITIWYNIATKPVCKPTLIKKAISISCFNKGRKNKWILVRTVRCRYPGEYTIKYFERDVYNSKTCSCKRIKKSRKVSICCKPTKFIKRCRNNAIEHIRISEVPRALKCNIVSSTKRFPIICRKPRTEVVGNCHGKVIRYRTVSYRIVKCRCVRRVRYRTIMKRSDSIKCVRHMSWRRSHIPYKLINGLCVAQPARITYRYIGCSKLVRFVDKRIDECTFKRSFIGKYPKHCKCTDFVKKTKILNYRCCQKSVVMKTCEHNKTKVTTRISYRLLDFKCFPVKKVTKRKLRCRLRRRERISTGLCTYVIRKYSVFIRKCKCYRKLIKVIKKERCCKKPKVSYRCDAKTGKKIFVTISYQHTKDDVCIKLRRVVSNLINCHRIKCTKTESRCIKNTKTVYMYCHLRKACKCIRTKVKEFRHCCGSLFKWIKTGNCGQHKKYYIRRRYYRLKMDKAGKRCRAVLVKEQFVRCKCPKSFTKMTCVLNRYNKVIRYYYLLKKGTCFLKKSQKLVLISSCPEKTKIKVRDHCSKKTGWRYVVYRIIYPKHCKCVEKKHSFKEICICSVAFPSSKERIYCKKDNTIVRDKRVAICTRKRVKWTIITISIKIVHCKKVKIEIGLCYRDRNGFAISIRYDTKVQYFTKKCRCQRKVIKRILKHCACRANHRSKQCVANSIVIKNYSYSIKRGRCQQRVRKSVRKVPCPNKPSITKSKCRRNKYIVTKRTYSRKNCRCLVSIRRKTCDCKCRKNRKYRKCSRNYAILEVSIVYHKKHCRCVRRKSIQQFVPSCPRFIVKTKGPCVPGKTDFYREIIRRKLVKDFKNCKCLVKEVKRKRICACRKTIEKRRRCVSNHKVVEVWGWKVNRRRNRCERYLVSSNSVPKRCPKRTIRIICNPKTGVEKKIITTYLIRQCKCLKRIRVKKSRCKCKKGLVLVEEGKCAKRPVCVRIDKYRYEILVKGKCIKKLKEVKVICCCAKKQKYKRCEGHNMVTVIISFTLKLGKCVKSEIRTSAHLKCSSKVTVKESKCGKNGFKIRRYFKEKLRNCKCVKRMVDEDRCQCRCQRNFKRKICNIRKRFIKTITVTFHLKKCKCIRKKSTEILSIKCPSEHSSVSLCIRIRKTNYWLKTTRTTRYFVNNRCVCVPRVYKKSKICRCKRNRKTKVICSAKKHALIYVTKFTVLRNGQCVRVANTRIQRIRCNGKWRLKSESGCQPRGFYGVKTLTYSKLVHDKCRCKEISKTKRCHCACSGIPSSTVCVKERIHRKIYKYKIIKCKCRQLIRSENVSFVKCRKIRPKIGKCKIVRNRCVKVVVHRIPYTINCRCHYRRKLVYVPCKTCRCPQYTTKKCQASSNRFVIKRHICHILGNGLIQKSVEVKMKEIHCVSIMTCRQVTKCHKKSMTQKFLCRVPHKTNCKCRSKEVKRTYPCKCKPDEMKIGKCNRKTCLKTLTRKIFHLVVLTNNKVKCQEEKRFYKQKCCCPPNPKDVVKCIHNRKIRKTVRFVFDKSQKTCSIIRRSFDETPLCQPPVRKIKGKCDKKRCLKRITSIKRRLVNCQCRKRRDVKLRKCCCLRKDHIKVKCIKNVSVVSKYRFVFKNGKCHKFVNRINHIIKCRRSHVHRGKCNLRTGFRVLRIHKYRKEKCRCIRSVKVKELRCICKPNTVNQICLKDKGIIRKIFTSYKLNERRNRCDKFIRNEDRQISCNKNEKTECSPTTRREKNGAFRKCTTTWKERVGCKCEEQIHWIFSLLHCEKPTTTRKCIENNIVSTKIYYVKERSLVKNYDYKCVKKRKVIVSPRKLCTRSYTTSTDCIDSFKTYTYHYHKRIMCQCVPMTKVYRVKCSCEGPKVVQTQCIDDIRIRTTIRSYKLQCDRKRIPTCRCVFIDTQVDKDVKCPDDKFNEKCVHEAMIRTWTTYDIQNCKCVAESQTDSRPDCKESICKDVLTNNKCHKIKKFGKCNQMNIYYQFLCPLTCGYCEKCDKPAIKKYLSECSCKMIAGKRICSRSVLVIEFIPDGKKCRKVKRIVESLCDCSNILPNSVCEKSMRDGRCGNPRIRAKCAYHCNPKCQHCERNRVYKICLQSGPNKGKYEILRIKYFKIEGACFFIRKISYEGSCELCSKRRTKIVTSCFEGKRFVITKYVVKRRDGTCKNMERRVAYSCTDCCNEIITKIGVCGSRSRVVIITFWANIKGCCRKQKVVNKYACNNRCARIESVQSRCMYNKQLVIKTWYSDKMCLPHTVYELADCHP